MIEKQGTMVNPYGLHCRPADMVRRSVEGYEGKIEIVSAEGVVANPHKVLSLLTLALTKGDTFTVRVDGPDEEKVADKLVNLLQSTFEY